MQSVRDLGIPGEGLRAPKLTPPYSRCIESLLCIDGYMRGKEFSSLFHLFSPPCITLEEINFLGYSWIFFMNILCQISANQRPSTPNELHTTRCWILSVCSALEQKISHKKFHNYGTNWTEHQGWCFLALGSKRNTGEAGNFSLRCYRGNNNRRQDSRKKNKVSF